MDNSNEIIIVVVVGLILIILLCTLTLSMKLPSFKRRPKKEEDLELKEGKPGDPQICPVCSAFLTSGQLVSSAAFPAGKGSKDRLMHIRGCIHCIPGKRERVCPVCKTTLEKEDHLISRLFERSIRRSHVHVVGCSKCKGPRSGRPTTK